MTIQTTQLADLLKTDPGVAPGYRHAPKRVIPGEPLEPAGSVLKWYALHPEDRPVPDDIARLARHYLLETPLEARGLGFVILLLSTWRHSNELWETVFYKNGDAMADFAPFPRDGAHKPCFCVWELAAVWHEKQAWERFLASARDEAAAQAWLEDCYSGPA